MQNRQSSCNIVNKYCKSFIYMSSTAPTAEWLGGHAVQKARGRWSDSRRRHTLSFWIVCLYPINYSSAKTIQTKSSMAFTQSYGWTEIDLILKQIWRWFIWWQGSFKSILRFLNNLFIWTPSASRFLCKILRNAPMTFMDDFATCLLGWVVTGVTLV